MPKFKVDVEIFVTAPDETAAGALVNKLLIATPDSLEVFNVMEIERQSQIDLCSSFDLCTPSYFQGCNLPYIQIPVHREMSMRELRAAGREAIAQDMQNEPEGADGDWYEDAHQAFVDYTDYLTVNRKTSCFDRFEGLEPAAAYEDGESVYLYLKFTPND